MSGHDLTHPAAAVLVAAALTLTPPAAFGCGWWGDSADDTDDSVVVGPDGAPVEDSEPAGPTQMARLSAAYRRGDGVPRDLPLARQWARSPDEVPPPPETSAPIGSFCVLGVMPRRDRGIQLLTDTNGPNS